MKHQTTKNKLNHYTKLFVLISTVCTLSSCAILENFFDGFLSRADSSIAVVEKALGDISANAGNFESILEEAIGEVSDSGIKADLQDALNKAIVTTSTELKCDIQFTGDYLEKRLQIILAKLKKTTPPAAKPRVCTVIPSSIDMNRPANSRNQVMVTGYFLSEDFSRYQLQLYNSGSFPVDVTRHLSTNTDFKLVANLGSNGIQLNNRSNKLVLKWNNQLISEIQVIQPVIEPCKLRERNLTGLSKMVLVPEHKKLLGVNVSKGDKEFAGNGPCVRGWVQLSTKNSGRELWATAFVQMWECPDDLNKSKHDYTYGDIKKSIKLTTADNGWYFKSIKDNRKDNFEFIDTDGHPNTIAGEGPVHNYKIIGDTSGSDIGESRVEITFKSIAVTLEQLRDCIRNPNKHHPLDSVLVEVTLPGIEVVKFEHSKNKSLD